MVKYYADTAGGNDVSKWYLAVYNLIVFQTGLLIDFIGSFFNFDKTVNPPSSRTLSRTPLLSRMNSQVETTLSNAQISVLRPGVVGP